MTDATGMGKKFYYDDYRSPLRPNIMCVILKHKLVANLQMTTDGWMYQQCQRCYELVFLKGNGWT